MNVFRDRQHQTIKIGDVELVIPKDSRFEIKNNELIFDSCEFKDAGFPMTQCCEAAYSYWIHQTLDDYLCGFSQPGECAWLGPTYDNALSWSLFGKLDKLYEEGR